MPSSDNSVAALRRHAAATSQRKQQAVLEALQELADLSEPVTISAVARAAQVTREFIYSHPHLAAAIRTAATRGRSEARSVRTPDRAAGLRADRSTLLAQIERQRAVMAQQQRRIDDLGAQRQRWLGWQLEQLEAVDLEAHAELQIAHDRLMHENLDLARQLGEARRLVSTLRDELEASRQAHQEDINALSRASAKVTVLTRGPASHS